MPLTDNGRYWETYTLEDAMGFLWGQAVGPEHPSRIAARIGMMKLLDTGHKDIKSILEVPCASGAEYESLRTLGDVTCMDRTPVMLQALKMRYPKAKTLQGDIREIPAKDGQFDWVYARAIFEHLPDLKNVELAMLECMRVAKIGCVFSFFLPPGDEEKIDWNGVYFNNTYRLKDILGHIARIGGKVVSVEPVSVKGTQFVDDGLIIYVKKHEG